MSKRGTKRKTAQPEKERQSLDSFSWWEASKAVGIASSPVKFSPPSFPEEEDEEIGELLGWLKLHCISDEIDNLEFTNDILNKYWITKGTPLYYQNSADISSSLAEGKVGALLSYVVARASKLPHTCVIFSEDDLCVEEPRRSALSQGVVALKVMSQMHEKAAELIEERLDPKVGDEMILKRIKRFLPVYALVTDLSRWILLAHDGAFFKECSTDFNLSFVKRKKQTSDEEVIKKEKEELSVLVGLVNWIFDQAKMKGEEFPRKQLVDRLADERSSPYQTRSQTRMNITNAPTNQNLKSPAVKVRKIVGRKKRKTEIE